MPTISHLCKMTPATIQGWLPEEVGNAHVHAANISCEPIGYNTNISTGRVEWDRLKKLDSTPCIFYSDISLV